MAKRKTKKAKQVETLRHEEATRTNIPTAEYEPVIDEAVKRPIMVAYERRNPDLDPQLVWRGKDMADWSELVVPAPPLYIQEKVHPKVLIDELKRESEQRAKQATPDAPVQMDLFADFNGIPDGATDTEFYQHDANWSNRIILGDSLQVMASLAEREGLRGKVQCIYLDPPYGIKFNSNFQWSTTSRDVKDGRADHITREPEQVKAFRDTWRDGIHSYFTYLRDRLTVARDLLEESGAIFVQIGDENVHRVRAIMEEVFGEENFVTVLSFSKTSSLGSGFVDSTFDYIIWFYKNIEQAKFRRLYWEKTLGGRGASQYNFDMIAPGVFDSVKDIDNPKGKIFAHGDMRSQTASGSTVFPISELGLALAGPGKGGWKTNREGMNRLFRSTRLIRLGNSLRYVRYFDDYPVYPMTASWPDTGISGFGAVKAYVVQTLSEVIKRCVLMTSNPGDLVVDPTCGSGTTAYVAEQWGRRWITIDTSRVALALARARIMGARYPYFLLSDSEAGRHLEAEMTRTAPSSAPTFGDIRQGFVYERVPHIMLRDITNNAEIDVIWEACQERLEPLRDELNATLGKNWEEWEIPREAEEDWPDAAYTAHEKWWELRIARQQEIDASIAAKADQEHLYDKPYEDKSIVRVAGPFTVESLSPHRVLAVDEDDELQPLSGSVFHEEQAGYEGETDFAMMILENLKTAGVQQAQKKDKINFTSLVGWPGEYICAEGLYQEGETSRRAGIFIGPEFGTVSRPDLVAAAREAADAGFDVLIACAFNYDAHSAEFERLGRIPILKARMNADLHMAGDLANTGKGNLFVIFGEPDIEIRDVGEDQIEVEIHGVDVFHPQSGEVRSSGPDDIACWFIDTDYNEESFFVRQAYFLGMNDPYKSLKTTLKAEIDREAWESLYGATSRPFDRPQNGRIAVKVINHLGDEVMKVFSVN